MDFCVQCDNLVVYKAAAADLMAYCRHCNTCTPVDVPAGGACVHSVPRVDGDARIAQVHLDHAEHDPTLPRTNSVACANAACPASSGGGDVLYACYHTSELRFVYKCCVCKHTWHS